MRGFPWPKSMTWGTGSLRWVRPLQRILCLFDGAGGSVHDRRHRQRRSDRRPPVHGVRPAGEGCGLRRLSRGARRQLRRARRRGAQAAHPGTRANTLRRRGSRTGRGRRAAGRSRGTRRMADPDSGRDGPGLPRPAAGGDPHLHAHAPEAISRCATRATASSRRTSSSSPTSSRSTAARLVAAGNARVLSARLNDARFFWDEDRKAGNFERWLDKLKRRHLPRQARDHGRAGRAARATSRSTSRPWSAPTRSRPREAARLAKADLASGMVGEFPELQGVMGGYYAPRRRR